ncbi:hypothetical protein [Alteribacillus iranensis]|uniref:DUF4352 domain-containing protein n=1 Tax=Alteribacillus iranensis TaxID=930128 RepID=A0A1I2BF84_9BACI|nr:hypothetical protein [Alteribacillus iranensis]SFE53810.1 hypothetical protein SAMN05192532_102221 [Alteribacillus iranensis]
MKRNVIVCMSLWVFILAGCGTESPDQTVDGYLSAIQSGDLEAAGSFVAGGEESLTMDEEGLEDEEMTAEMIDAISNGYEYESPEVVSEEEGKAVVKTDITSVDFAHAFSKTIAEVMPLALASAFEEQTEESEQAYEDLVQETLMDYLTDEDANMTTRTVELTLEEDEDGSYKIVDDENLAETIFANYTNLEDMFGSGEAEAVSVEETEEQTVDSEVVQVIAEDEAYDVEPIQFTLNELSFKKVANLPAEEQNRISMTTDKEVGEELEYIYINYTAKNTSEEDITFYGIQEAVVFADGKQEKVDLAMSDFIDYDEAEDSEYYGKVHKEGEQGAVFSTPLADVEKVRLTISSSMNSESYDQTSEEQVIEFEINE